MSGRRNKLVGDVLITFILPIVLMVLCLVLAVLVATWPPGLAS